MSDLYLYVPAHGYSNDDPIFVSFLNGIYYVSDKTTDAFRLATTSGGTSYVQFTETITSGTVRHDASTGVSSVTGLSHLEGQSVMVMTGGEIHGTFTVTNGAITFSRALPNFQIGRAYALKIKTMRLAAPSSPEGLQSRIKRINETVARTIKSIDGEAGQEYDGTEYMDDLNTEYSETATDQTILTKGGFSTDGYTVVKSDDPYPFTLLSTIITFSVDE